MLLYFLLLKEIMSATITSTPLAYNVVSGMVTVNDLPLIEGDGLSFIDENNIEINPTEESEIILFDLV